MVLRRYYSRWAAQGAIDGVADAVVGYAEGGAWVDFGVVGETFAGWVRDVAVRI